MSTVILGTGIIGLATAFYLSESIDPTTVHLVETTPVLFSSASGYAGGFLAEDWFSDASAELGALSFAEHRRIADKYGGAEKWGYSSCTGTTYAPSRGAEVANGKDVEEFKAPDVWCREGGSRVNVAPSHPSDGVSQFVEDPTPNHPRWLSRTHGDKVDVVSEVGTTAQVDPRKLCQFLLYKCQTRGVQLHHPAKAISIGSDENDQLSSIRLLKTKSKQEIDIPCTRLLISAGAWSPQVFKTLFPSAKTKIPVTSLAGHSLVVTSPRWQKTHEGSGCHAIFTTDEQGYSPEIFSRIGGEIYVAGQNSESIPLPKTAQDAEIDEEILKTLRITAKRMLGLPNVDDLVEVRKGLCFRPLTRKGTPLLSRIQDTKLGGVRTKGGSEGGVYLAAGHGPWGISMSLGTGKIMSELIRGAELSADISGLKL